GRRLPGLIDRFDFQQIEHEGATLTGRGGDVMALFTQMTDVLLRERFVAMGFLTEADFDVLARACDDPPFWFVRFPALGVWGRRPSQNVCLRQPVRMKSLDSCDEPFSCPVKIADSTGLPVV